MAGDAERTTGGHGLFQSWDDAVATRLFTPNVEQDEPVAERRRKVTLVRQRIGDFAEDQARPAEFDSPAHCRWWLRGEHGTVQAEILLTPERHPRVQSVTLAVPPDPDSALGRAPGRLVPMLNDPASEWPSALPVSATVDTGWLLRQFRAAGAWAGRCQAGAFCRGDGETFAAIEVDGETARFVMEVIVDPVRQLLQQVEITPRT